MSPALSLSLSRNLPGLPITRPNQADWFGGRWSGLSKPADPETARRNVETGITKKLFDSLGRTLTTVPDGLNIHATLGRVLEAKKAMFASRREFRLGDRRGARFRCVAVRRLWRAPVGSGFGARHLQPAARRLGRPGQ